MYLKRARTPTTWPIARKGTKYVVVPSHNQEEGVSLMVMLRDHLGVGETRREVRKAIIAGRVLVNGRVVKNGRYGLALNDVITLGSGEHYRLTYSETKKFTLEKITAAEAEGKVTKVVGKRLLRGNKIQVSLLDGRNMIVDKDITIGSSAVVDLKTNKIKKVLPLEKGAEVIVISGKHIGKKGRIEEVSSDGVGRVAFKEKKIGLKLNNLMAVK